MAGFLFYFMKKYATFVLRIGLAAVLFWFAINQLISPDDWTKLVPEYLSFIDSTTIIYFNATFELILGITLLAGLFTRVFALLFGLHLIPIIISLGYGPSAVRDVGLMLAAFSLALSGSKNFSIDAILKRKSYKKEKA